MPKNIEELAQGLKIERQKILSLLVSKKWFKSTSFDIQKKIFDLPNDFDGYLQDLTIRPSEYGGMVVVKLLDINRGNYNINSVFEVMSLRNNQVFTYEYTSWKYGSNPGYRGIIFLEVDDAIKYFILRRTDKFSLGKTVLETIGSFIQFKDNTLLNIPKTLEDQIKLELGLNKVVVDRFIDLGRLNPDPAMVNTETLLYAAVIKIKNIEIIKRIERRIFHTKPINYKLSIEPIENIKDLIQTNNESFFLACILRLILMKTIKI